jgi:hypothetical protein
MRFVTSKEICIDLRKRHEETLEFPDDTKIAEARGEQVG